MDFTITITDPLKLAGITAARTAYNEALPKDEEGNPVGALTDAEYVQMVADNATSSYAQQYEAAIAKAMEDEAFAAKLAAAAAE